ncbi:ABC transporter B family protein, related [Eimeria tenella]|uniref:ABC transporter B family protein, related n=1 Tax=Eimeria tenella TaxID=5802 RepID=U6L9J4_EIMTE|nr:ABC transporter B family protein, related [Eimeria tenella]CDJ44415.1 ABC transporter B family protein, related [Eimeria tenella]|eukprot:XP_013235164.1 ABC transporter B family protein, related [Eimeria tenella]
MKFVAIPYNLLLVVGSLAVALATSWQVTLCAAAGLLPAVAFGALLAGALRRAAAAAAAALEAAGAVAAETLGAPRTVAAFGQEGASRARYEQHIAAAEAAAARGGLFSGLGMAGLISSVFAMFALVFYLSGRKVAAGWEQLLQQQQHLQQLQQLDPPLPPGAPNAPWGAPGGAPGGAPWGAPGGAPLLRPEFQGGAAFVISVCLLMAAFSLGNVLESVGLFLKAGAAAKSLGEVGKEVSEINPFEDKGDKLVSLDGDICFRRVSFAYPTRRGAPVFKDFSLTIPRGRAVGLVGPSGAGKSTLLQLLQRLYDPDSGSVSVAGRSASGGPKLRATGPQGPPGPPNAAPRGPGGPHGAPNAASRGPRGAPQGCSGQKGHTRGFAGAPEGPQRGPRGAPEGTQRGPRGAPEGTQRGPGGDSDGEARGALRDTGGPQSVRGYKGAQKGDPEGA